MRFCVIGFLGFWVLGSGLWVLAGITPVERCILLYLGNPGPNVDVIFNTPGYMFRHLWKQMGATQVCWTRMLAQHIGAIASICYFLWIKNPKPNKVLFKIWSKRKIPSCKNWSKSVYWFPVSAHLQNHYVRQIIVGIGNQVAVLGLLWENINRESLVNLKKRKFLKKFYFFNLFSRSHSSI